MSKNNIYDLSIQKLYKFIREEEGLKCFLSEKLKYQSINDKRPNGSRVFLYANSKAVNITITSVMNKYKTKKYQEQIQQFIEYITYLKLVEDDEFIESCLVADLLSTIGKKIHLKKEYYIDKYCKQKELEPNGSLYTLNEYNKNINQIISISIYENKIPLIDDLQGMQYVLLNFKKYWKKYKEIKQELLDNEKENKE